MIVIGSCYFLLTLLTPYDQNIDFCFPLIVCSVIVLFGFALSESTWRTVRSQEPRLPDADRVRHCTCQTPEIIVRLFLRLFLFRFQICERKTDNEFLFHFSFSSLRTKNETRIPFSFFVFKREVRKTKNEFLFRFCI